MIPYLSWWRRIVAWLLWHFEGFDKMDLDESAFYVLEHPDLTHTASLLRDYWYIKRAGGVE